MYSTVYMYFNKHTRSIPPQPQQSSSEKKGADPSITRRQRSKLLDSRALGRSDSCTAIRVTFDGMCCFPSASSLTGREIYGPRPPAHELNRHN